jgi:hypothetical protein
LHPLRTAATSVPGEKMADMRSVASRSGIGGNSGWQNLDVAVMIDAFAPD